MRSSRVRRHSAQPSPATASTTSTTPIAPVRLGVTLNQNPLPTFSKPSQPLSMISLWRRKSLRKCGASSTTKGEATTKATSIGRYRRSTSRRSQTRTVRPPAATPAAAAPRQAKTAATVAGSTSMPRLYLVDVASPAATAPATSQRRPSGGGRPDAAPGGSRRRRGSAGRRAVSRAAAPRPRPGGPLQQDQRKQREGDGRHVGDGHVRVGHVERRHRQEQRREQAGRAAEGDPAQPVDEVHRGRPHGHRQQPAQQEVRTGVDDERGLGQQVAVAQQPPHRRRQQVERAGQVEVERRIEEELRVEVAARGGERLGHHHALVGVDEAVRQPPGDALEPERQREDEDGGEKDAGDADPAAAAGGADAHPPAAGAVAAPPLASSRKQLTAPV